MRTGWLAVGLVWLVGWASPVRADLVTIEHFVEPVTFGAAVNRNITRAQAFTVTHTGKLVSIELQIGRPVNGDPTDSLTVEILGTLADGFPDLNDIKFTRVLTKDEVPGVSNIGEMTNFVPIDLGASAFPVAEGEQLVINLRSQTGSTPDWYLWATDGTDQFEGRYFFRAPPSDPYRETTFDAGFRANLAVPEPGTAGLTGLATMLIIGSRWRCWRRQRSARRNLQDSMSALSDRCSTSRS